MRHRLPLLLALALHAHPAGAASPLEIEREVTRVAAEHERLEGERRRLQSEALALADQVAALKSAASPARAGGDLSRRLRDFDRLAGRLDAVERDLTAQERLLARLHAEVEASADAEEGRLEQQARGEGARLVAPRLAALQETRRRVSARRTESAFRPPLEIAIEPTDGPAEIEAKIAVLDGEISRIAARLPELRREEGLLARRLEARREWARQLAAARRDAAGGVELLDRGYEDAAVSLRELGARAEALVRERGVLEAAQQGLTARRAEAEGRLGELRKTR